MFLTDFLRRCLRRVFPCGRPWWSARNPKEVILRFFCQNKVSWQFYPVPWVPVHVPPVAPAAEKVVGKSRTLKTSGGARRRKQRARGNWKSGTKFGFIFLFFFCKIIYYCSSEKRHAAPMFGSTKFDWAPFEKDQILLIKLWGIRLFEKKKS